MVSRTVERGSRQQKEDARRKAWRAIAQADGQDGGWARISGSLSGGQRLRRAIDLWRDLCSERLAAREDDLAEQLSVSRTSIREAVKVLSAKGLLQARRRVGVRVRDRDDWDLLDPQVLSWHPDVGRDEALTTSLIEARRIIEPAAAGLAAKRATAADLARNRRPIWE